MEKHYNSNFPKVLFFVLTLLIPAAWLQAQTQTIGSSADNPFPVNQGNFSALAKEVNEGGVFYYNPSLGSFSDTNATGYIAIANMAEGSYFKLTEDITLNSGDVAAYDGVISLSSLGWQSWRMLGTEAHPFDGHFNGDFHIASGFIVTGGGNGHGFFGAIANHAEIKNLGVENSYISGTDATGGIVGKALGGKVDSCFFSGTISASGNYTGGLVGHMEAGTVIANSYASATINAKGSQVGGIVGKVNSPSPACSLQNVYSSCIVYGSYQYTGGIVGENLNASTTYSNCFYNKQLIDCKVAPNSDPNSTAAGTGLETSQMANNSWAPAPSFTNIGSELLPHINGFNPTKDAVLFSLIPISLPPGTTLSDLSTVSKITMGSTPGATWHEIERIGTGHFDTLTNTLNLNGQCYVVLKLSKGERKRVFIVQCNNTPYIGAETNPFLINNVTDLTEFRNGINTGAEFQYKRFVIPASGANTYFLQTADIEMPSGDNIGKDASRAFRGTYDGGGHKITNLRTHGFFAYTNNATVKNLTVERSISTRAALIYSMSNGTVDNCHSIGSVATAAGLIYETANVQGSCLIKNSSNRNNTTPSLEKVGGIVSVANTEETILENCHNYGNINGNFHVGGLVGSSDLDLLRLLTVRGCSNRGKVTNNSTHNQAHTGGLVGKHRAVVTHSYNTGNVHGDNRLVAGITPFGMITYCYNLGTITGGHDRVAHQSVILGISDDPCRCCFNAGKVMNHGTGLAYALSRTGAHNCFNAGEVSALTGISEYCVGTDGNYNIGGFDGQDAIIKCNYHDLERADSNYTQSTSEGKSTSQMTSGQLGLGSGWVEEAGLYPRIKGLDTCMASYAVALPITFGAPNDNVNHVSADFTVANAQGIKWRIEGNFGASIADDGNGQKVILPADRTGGNIILAAYKGSETYYRITLKMVTAPSGVLEVTSFEDLQQLQAGINSGSAFKYKNTAVPAGGQGTTFKVTSDFAFPKGHNWTPIGTQENPFLGTFDGNGKTLRDLSQSSVKTSGLFGYVRGTVENLTLSNVNIKNVKLGGVVCAVLRGGTVNNCKTSGSMVYDDVMENYPTIVCLYMGGIVGIASQAAVIKNCHNSINVTGKTPTCAAGIVASCSIDSYVDTCINAGSITGGLHNAGICTNGGNIRYCINHGDVSGLVPANAVAGISTQASKLNDMYYPIKNSVTACVNSGNISSLSSVGCVVAGISVGSDGSAEDCINAGQVKGDNCTVVGISTGTVQNCVNVGQVRGRNAQVYAVSNRASSHCFYDTQMCTAADYSPNGATAKTTVEMCGTNLATALGANFHFENNMYPRVAGIKDHPASLAISSPVFLADNQNITKVDSDFTMGGCSNYGVSWSINSSVCLDINNMQCSTSIVSPGILDFCATQNGTVYKRVPLQVRMDALVIKNKTELEKFRNGMNEHEIFYYNPIDSTFHDHNNPDPAYVTIPVNGKDAIFRLSQDIDLEGALWVPISDYNSNNQLNFEGTFDADNHSIRNFVIPNSAYSGLFGRILGASITNLKIDSVRSEGTITNNYVGVLAGELHSSTLSYTEVSNANISTSGLYTGFMAGRCVSSSVSYCTTRNNTLTNSAVGSIYAGGFFGELMELSLTHSLVNKNTIETQGNLVGGFIGEMKQNSYAPVMNNLRSDSCVVKGGYYVGGISGFRNYTYGTGYSELHVNGGSVTATRDFVGGLFGFLAGVTLTNSSNSATVTGGKRVGGIAGEKYAREMSNVRNFGDVRGSDYVGGISGFEGAPPETMHNHDNIISRSVNTGHVTGNNYVGGIRGISTRQSRAAVECINLGEVDGNQYVGGIVGWSQASAEKNVNAAKVNGTRYVGGIVGYQSNHEGFSNKLTSSLSVGQVSGKSDVGNVAGYYQAGSLTNCYYDKQISPDYKGVGELDADVPGIAEGKSTSEMLNTTLSLSGFTAAAGLYPRPTAVKDNAAVLVAASPVNLIDDKTAYTIPGVSLYSFTPMAENGVTWTCEGTALENSNGTFSPKTASWDVLTATKDDFSKKVHVAVGNSKEFPCVIKDQEQLNLFAQYINSGDTFYYNTPMNHLLNPSIVMTFTDQRPQDLLASVAISPGGENAFFKLADNFNPDLQGIAWTGVGTSANPFKGDFNGNGRTVSNLPSATADNHGFFGVNRGVIYDLVIENPAMTSGTYSKVGALCGHNDRGVISNCHVVNGSVTGAVNVGGLVGTNTGFVKDCHNSASVNGTNNVGGIAGYSTYPLTRCFNLGDIAASAPTTVCVGGVVGYAYSDSAIVSHCYNAGRVTASGGSSGYAGGVVGDKTGQNFSNCYNIGEVTASANLTTGALAGRYDYTYVSSLAYDNQMCTSEAYGSGNGNARSMSTASMLGTALQTILGNDGTWTYTDSLYPRLASMKDMEASVASVTPVVLTLGESVANVEHEFTVGIGNGVAWSVNPPGILDVTSQLPIVTYVKCVGSPELSVAQGTGKESKKVKLNANFTMSVVQYDTVCGGSYYTWATNGIDYHTTNTVVYNVMENECPVTHTLFLQIPKELKVDVTPKDQQCYNTNTGSISASVTGGFGQYSYSWKNENGIEISTSNPVTNLPVGTYSLTVTDGRPVPKNVGEDYCTVTVDNIVINPVTELKARIDTSSAGCYNVTDGMFQISVEGGVAPYTVSWNNDEGSRSLNIAQERYTVNNLPAGNYNVKVTDNNGCTKTDGLAIDLNEDTTRYKITACGYHKIYDGLPLDAGKFFLQIGNGITVSYSSDTHIRLANGDTLTATVEQNTLTDAGEYPNNVTSYSVTRNGQDVTCLYNIEVIHGKVIIDKRNVTVTSADSMARLPLSSTCLERHQVTVTNGSFTTADEVKISYNFTGSICNAITSATTPNTFSINWGGANPNNYNITLIFGTLTVVSLDEIMVTAQGMVKTYDGVTVTYGQDKYNIAAYGVVMNAGGYGVHDTVFFNSPNMNTVQVNGRTYIANVVLNGGNDISITDAGMIENIVTSVSVLQGNNDITGSLFNKRTLKNDTLKVLPREITLTSPDGNWIYDAQPHSAPIVTATESFVPADISYGPVATTTATNVGNYTNDITYTTTSNFKTQNYIINQNLGQLVISARTLQLMGIDSTAEVTGTEQRTTKFSYGNLVEGHTASGISYEAKGTAIGTYFGGFSGTLSVKDTFGSDVTNNYQTLALPGVLEIQSAQGKLEMKSESTTRVYDGNAITLHEYIVKFKGARIYSLGGNDSLFKLPSGDTLKLTPTGDAIAGWTDAGGPYDNTFKWDIIPAGNKTNYTDTALVTGQVTVSKRKMTITSNTLTRLYNGSDIASENVTVTGSVFVPGQGANYTFENYAPGSRTNVGTYVNKFNYTLTSGTNANNYEIDTVYGRLTVVKDTLPIVITSGDRSFNYDGYPHSYPSYTVTYDGSNVARLADDSTRFVLPTGDTLAITNPASITSHIENAADNNTFDYTVGNPSCYDASAVTRKYGTIKIYAYLQSLKIASHDKEWTYDGDTHYHRQYTVEFDGTAITGNGQVSDTVFVLPAGDTLTITGAPGITDEGTLANTFAYSLQNDTLYIGPRDTVYGKLTVHKALALAVDTVSGTLCPGETGYARLKVTGGKPAAPKYRYSVSNGSTTASYTTNDSVISLTGLNPATYTVTVTEALGNTATATFEIKMRPALTAANSSLVCPPDIDDTIRHAGCKLKLNIGAPAFTTSSGIPAGEITISSNAPADSVYPVGETVVRWVAKSLCGDSIYCEQKVKVSFLPCPDAVDFENTHYPAVRLGGSCKCWTAENLKSTRYSDGRTVENVMDYHSHEYPNTAGNVNVFGRLYDWYAAADTGRYGSVDSVERAYRAGNRIQGICPDGWYLPSDDEYDELNIYPTTDLRSTSHWINGANNTNSTGFNSLPGGKYNCATGRFEELLGNSYYWSCHPVYDKASGAMIDYICEKIVILSDARCNGYSVRCVYNEPTGTTAALPAVSTNAVSNLTAATADCGGEVTDDGGANVTARGVCWSTSQNPTIADSHTIDGSGTGSFGSNITGLTANTTYYVRAYATNSEGTAYGNEVSFTTVVIDTKSCPEARTVTDHENNVYATVKIGNQCWMRENLRTTTSPSTGTYLVTTNDTASYTGKQARWYGNDSTTYAPLNYGLLYNWNAAVDTFTAPQFGETSVNDDFRNAVSVTFTGHRRGICPEGWHLPSNADWDTLTTYVSSKNEYTCNSRNTYIAKALADTTGWQVSTGSDPCAVGENRSENNKTGFSAVPAGNCSGSSFDGAGVDATFWSSTQSGSGVWYRSLYYTSASVGRIYSTGRNYSYSVRCVKDNDAVIDEKSCPEAKTVTDVDNNAYATVKIGNQCWMRQNLRTKNYANGDPIPAGEGNPTSYIYDPYYYEYPETETDIDLKDRGLLYNFSAATKNSTNTFPIGVQGICPTGWHLPSDAEWNIMEKFVSGSDWQANYADSMGYRGSHAGKLAGGDKWNYSSIANAPGNTNYTERNASGFSAVPAGDYSGSSFSSAGVDANFWSSTPSGIGGIWYRVLRYRSASVRRYDDSPLCGFSVRCVKD